MSTPKKALRFTAESIIFKEPSVGKRKAIGFRQPCFQPRSNLKPKKKNGLFRTMVFKTYLHLSIPISIQNVVEFGETEKTLFTALTSIWKKLASIDQHTVILSWHPRSRILCVLSALRTSCQNPKQKDNQRSIH